MAVDWYVHTYLHMYKMFGAGRMSDAVMKAADLLEDLLVACEFVCSWLAASMAQHASCAFQRVRYTEYACSAYLCMY